MKKLILLLLTAALFLISCDDTTGPSNSEEEKIVFMAPLDTTIVDSVVDTIKIYINDTIFTPRDTLIVESVVTESDTITKYDTLTLIEKDTVIKTVTKTVTETITDTLWRDKIIRIPPDDTVWGSDIGVYDWHEAKKYTYYHYTDENMLDSNFYERVENIENRKKNGSYQRWKNISNCGRFKLEQSTYVDDKRITPMKEYMCHSSGTVYLSASKTFVNGTVYSTQRYNFSDSPEKY